MFTLKYGRDKIYVEQNWKKFIIFAWEEEDEYMLNVISRVTLIYIHKVSPVLTKIDIMNNASLSQEEKVVAQSNFERILIETLEKGENRGMEKGMEKMLSAYLKQNPASIDEAISTLFEVPLDFVRSVRKKLNKL